MIVILKNGTNQNQIEKLSHFFQGMGLKVHLSQGENATIMGLIGDTSQVDPDMICTLDDVEAVKRIQEPYKKASRKFTPEDTVV
ncbi:MAG: 3-deoxy-7-phosphoheptulonate synthase, partial [Clostridia bacterium]|nr:3-deoxy-7-phosphoheptulonate synthase [Clostridia bacterium]